MFYFYFIYFKKEKKYEEIDFNITSRVENKKLRVYVHTRNMNNTF